MKKIKRIKKKLPKYYNGELAVSINDVLGSNPQLTAAPLKTGATGAKMAGGNALGAITGGAQLLTSSISNVKRSREEGVSFGSVLGGIGSGAAMGASMGLGIPVIGPILGAVAGGLIGGVTSAVGRKGEVNPYTGDKYKADGLTRLLGLGRSDQSLEEESKRIKGTLAAKEVASNAKEEYAQDTDNFENKNIFATAAEGGIMRRPVDALVSKGELIYDPVTGELIQVPGSEGKPNRADDVYAQLLEGDVVFSNSPTMLMPNGKTPAQNLAGMVDKYSTGGTVKAKEAIIKKVVNWQEANKTKTQEYAKFDGGGIAKYGYNKNLSEFAYWDKDKNEYKKEYLDFVNNLTEQDVRDIEAEKYGKMSEYFNKNKGKKLDVATAQKLMTDKKYGNWHKIGQAIVDKKTQKTALSPEDTVIRRPVYEESVKTVTSPPVDDTKVYGRDGSVRYDYTAKERKVTPDELGRETNKHGSTYKPDGFNWLNTVSDFAPTLSALFGNYDYHTEQPQISPYRSIPTGVSIEPIRRAANESYAMARYNQSNLNPSTGAGMAYGLQAASNRAKTLADAYQWQQDTQNKLIAQNVGIYNDWAKRYDAARYQAIADTRANEGAAQQMRDQAIKDAYEFQTGRQNDRWKLSMLEPLMKYAVDDNIWKNFKMV